MLTGLVQVQRSRHLLAAEAAGGGGGRGWRGGGRGEAGHQRAGEAAPGAGPQRGRGQPLRPAGRAGGARHGRGAALLQPRAQPQAEDTQPRPLLLRHHGGQGPAGLRLHQQVGVRTAALQHCSTVSTPRVPPGRTRRSCCSTWTASPRTATSCCAPRTAGPCAGWWPASSR